LKWGVGNHLPPFLKMSIEKIKSVIKSKNKSQKLALTPNNLLSTGSTLLNLAFSGKPYGGLLKGKYFIFIGDSTSGKTWISLSCLAEAAINKDFDDYRLIYDNVEDGALMDIEHFFGSRVLNRLEAPNTDSDGLYIMSETVEDFYYHVDDAIKDGRPFIYILDSQDSLTSKAEILKFGKQKKASRNDTKEAGSYGGIEKAKAHSTNLRRLITPLKKSNSILIIVSQTRDNLGFGFETKTFSGGKALLFYSAVECWMSVEKELKRTVRKKLRQIGIMARVRVKKNRITGKRRRISIPIYHSSGMDDIGSCIDYLITENHWKKTKGIIKATELKVTATRSELICFVEDNNLESELQEVVGTVWNEIEEACKVIRKRKYD